MEFIISNTKFPQGENILENIYILGSFGQTDKCYRFQEGFIIDNCSYDNQKGSEDVVGIYNLLQINKDSSVLEVKSDKRNTMPIFYYFHNKRFGLSNNPWLLAQIFSDEMEIDESAFISHLVYCVDVVPGRTLLKGMKQLKSGEELKFDFRDNSLEIIPHYHFKYSPKKNIILEEELQLADDQFTQYFNFIKEHNSGKIAGFGCSGGLDSRLIAHYTNKVGMKTEYFVVGDFKNKNPLQSVTSLVSGKVASVYNHDIKKIPYSTKWLEESLLLDIRNHPFFFSQIFLNPIRELPSYDFHFSGDPGGVAYLAAAIIENNPESLKTHSDFFLGMRKDAMSGYTDLLRKSLHHLKIPMNPYNENGIFGLKHSLIDYVVNKKDIIGARKELFNVIDSAPGDNSVEKWFYIMDNITTRYMYSSGYTSMNRKKNSYLLYYPFFYEQIKHFPPEYLKNKFFLKHLLKYVNSEFSNIPDQNLNMMFKKQNILAKLYNRVELALRGRGLNILRMMQTKPYKDLIDKAFSRKNPVFEQYVDIAKLKDSDLLYTYAGAQYLKLKILTDIIYYKEFKSVIELREFEMV